jgi:vesicle-fusing ATPase
MMTKNYLFRVTNEPYDSDMMAKEFLMQFSGLAISNKERVFIKADIDLLFTFILLAVGQPLVFSFNDKKLLGLNIRSIEAIDASSLRDNKNPEPRKINFGRLTGNAMIQFEKAENSAINLVGKAKG